ncbi:hypothetical protein H072_6683 [Dactylellina haptotyla CBS 200.50]|uniref:F-box domain-containing protein n=1 Tax=Dactylellina haptotyla (strain CBS 200.50) TaxID=1284197 RepID=S8A9M6_DACHA|nr:hypothetical protein H072_6683 [Dactylellina haptotyla CBS 200.50]
MAAALRALSLPELLTPILAFAHDAIKSSTNCEPLATAFLFRTRMVSRLWCSVIDTAPLLQTRTYRNPRMRTNNEDWTICEAFVGFAIQTILADYLKRESRDFSAWKNSLEFCAPGFPDNVFITQPVVTEVALYFDAEGDPEWTSAFYNLRYDSQSWPDVLWEGHRAFLRRAEGITAKLVMDTVKSVIECWYGSRADFSQFGVTTQFPVPQGLLDKYKLWEREYSLMPISDTKLETI